MEGYLLRASRARKRPQTGGQTLLDANRRRLWRLAGGSGAWLLEGRMSKLRCTRCVGRRPTSSSAPRRGCGKSAWAADPCHAVRRWGRSRRPARAIRRPCCHAPSHHKRHRPVLLLPAARGHPRRSLRRPRHGPMELPFPNSERHFLSAKWRWPGDRPIPRPQSADPPASRKSKQLEALRQAPGEAGRPFQRSLSRNPLHWLSA